MAFLILSTGAMTGSSLRTVRLRTLLVAATVLLATVLAGGIALGLRMGAEAAMAAYGGPATLDPDEPGSRMLIDRVGELSARLIRLESEAVSLARQVGLTDEAARGSEATTSATESPGPSGGPLLAPAAADFSPALVQMSRNLDRLDATLALVAQAAALRNLASMAIPSRQPIEGGTLSSGFGNRRDPFTRRLARHTGIDIRAPHGAPILASAGGRVTFAGFRGAYGRMVEIDHGNGLRTRYGHAAKLFVRSGDVVLPRQRIAAVGSSGRSTGAHLHFEVLRNGAQVEPRLYLARRDAKRS